MLVLDQKNIRMAKMAPGGATKKDRGGKSSAFLVDMDSIVELFPFFLSFCANERNYVPS